MKILNQEVLQSVMTAHEARWADELSAKLPHDVDLTFEEVKILTRLNVSEWPDELVSKVKDIIDTEDFFC